MKYYILWFCLISLTFAYATESNSVEMVSSKILVNEDATTNRVNLVSQSSGSEVYSVQLGAFASRERAFAFYWSISRQISPVRVVAPAKKEKLYRVFYGSFPNYQEAKAASNKLKGKNIPCFVSTIKN